MNLSTLQLNHSVGRDLPGGAPWGLAPHALFTASSNLFRWCENIAQRDNILLTTHLAESREEMEMFRDAFGTALRVHEEHRATDG